MPPPKHPKSKKPSTPGAVEAAGRAGARSATIPAARPTAAQDHRAHLDRGQRARERVLRDACHSGCRRGPASAGELTAGTHPLGILFFFTMTREVRGFHAPGHRAPSSLPRAAAATEAHTQTAGDQSQRSRRRYRPRPGRE